MTKIEIFDYANEILRGVKGGAVLSASADGKFNCMTISWGTLGIEWGKPIFTTFVRQSRYTKEFLDKSGEFTACIPYGEELSEILKGCGTKSGRDIDKAKEYGLQLVKGVSVDSPAIKQFPLTLECKILYVQKQDEKAMPESVLENWYPTEDGSRDIHTAYVGEIVNAYILD
ncbi:MAG: flavin reductase family protein [Clostridia bacterium]|nr:flavin reductase family protein [Clostridia bacterium]